MRATEDATFGPMVARPVWAFTAVWVMSALPRRANAPIWSASAGGTPWGPAPGMFEGTLGCAVGFTTILSTDTSPCRARSTTDSDFCRVVVSGSDIMVEADEAAIAFSSSLRHSGFEDFSTAEPPRAFTDFETPALPWPE